MVMFIIATAMNFFSYWFSDTMVLKAYRAQEVGEDHYLYRIVADLAQRMAKITPPPPPAAVSAPARAPARAAAARPAPPPSVGFHYEWVVEKGQTLSLIAQGFDTTVQKILAANPGLKANNLRVGQKVIIPAEAPPKSAPKAAGRKRR